MGSNHLSSTALKNKTIIVQLPKIDISFSDFQNHAKNGDYHSGIQVRQEPSSNEGEKSEHGYT